MEIEIIKNRSVGAIIKDAFNLMANNLTTILRRTWLPALVLCLVQGLVIFLVPGTMLAASSPDLTPEMTSRMLRVGLLSLFVVVAAFVVYVWLYSRMLSLLQGLPTAQMRWRVLRCMLYMVAIVIIVGAIVGAISYMPFFKAGQPQPLITPETLNASELITAGLLLLFLIAFLPMAYSSMKYLVEPKQKVWSILGRPYRQGWRYWGFLFLMMILLGIIISVLYLLIQSPMYIILTAQEINAEGMLAGDPSDFGLPQQLLGFVVIVLCQFVSVYILFWALMVNYFAYGTIEARIAARQHATTATAPSSTLPSSPDIN